MATYQNDTENQKNDKTNEPIAQTALLSRLPKRVESEKQAKNVKASTDSGSSQLDENERSTQAGQGQEEQSKKDWTHMVESIRTERRRSSIVERIERYTLNKFQVDGIEKYIATLSITEQKQSMKERAAPMPFMVRKVISKCDVTMGDSDIITAVWTSIKNLAEAHILKGKAVPVPFLADSKSYDILNIIVKKDKDRWSRKTSEVHCLCNLESILGGTAEANRRTMNLLQNSQHSQTISKKMKFHLKGNETRPEKQQEINLKIFNLTHQQLEVPDDVQIHVEKNTLYPKEYSKVYLINEAWKAQYVLTVTTGDRKIHFTSEPMALLFFSACTCENRGEYLVMGNSANAKLRRYEWLLFSDEIRKSMEKKMALCRLSSATVTASKPSMSRKKSSKGSRVG